MKLQFYKSPLVQDGQNWVQLTRIRLATMKTLNKKENRLYDDGWQEKFEGGKH
jgi:hypothetical protein